MRLDDVLFLDVADVEAAHKVALAYGEGEGTAGIREQGLLDSAVMRARATFGGAPLYPSLAAMAAALLLGIAKNHPFLDGNKGVAFLAALAFLEVNGFPLTLGFEWVTIVERVATGGVDADVLALLFAAAMGGDVDVEAGED